MGQPIFRESYDRIVIWTNRIRIPCRLPSNRARTTGITGQSSFCSKILFVSWSRVLVSRLYLWQVPLENCNFNIHFTLYHFLASKVQNCFLPHIYYFSQNKIYSLPISGSSGVCSHAKLTLHVKIYSYFFFVVVCCILTYKSEIRETTPDTLQSIFLWVQTSTATVRLTYCFKAFPCTRQTPRMSPALILLDGSGIPPCWCWNRLS